MSDPHQRQAVWGFFYGKHATPACGCTASVPGMGRGAFRVSLLVESAVLVPQGCAMAANPATTIIAGDETGEIFGLRYRRSKSDSRLGSRMGGQRQCGTQTPSGGLASSTPPPNQT